MALVGRGLVRVVVVNDVLRVNDADIVDAGGGVAWALHAQVQGLISSHANPCAQGHEAEVPVQKADVMYWDGIEVKLVVVDVLG